MGVWIAAVTALFFIMAVLYGTSLIALLTRGRWVPTVRVRWLSVFVVLGTAFGAAVFADDAMAAAAVFVLTVLLDLALAGGRGLISVVWISRPQRRER